MFDLDASCPCGKVALFYVLGDSNPQVWFQDLACCWHFLAASFADFFRWVADSARARLLPPPLTSAQAVRDALGPTELAVSGSSDSSHSHSPRAAQFSKAHLPCALY